MNVQVDAAAVISREKAFAAELARLDTGLQRLQLVARRLAASPLTAALVTDVAVLNAHLEEGMEAIGAKERLIPRGELPVPADGLLQAQNRRFRAALEAISGGGEGAFVIAEKALAHG